MSGPPKKPVARMGAVSRDDARWGRVPGAEPPLKPRMPLLFALISGLVLAAVVLFLVRTPGGMDEHSFADQRNGLLARGPRVPAEVSGVQFGGRVVVLLFLRSVPHEQDVRRWSAGLGNTVTVRVIVQGSAPANGPGFADLPLVFDPAQALARVVLLPRPNDGGPGVGYAVVDSHRLVRYSTLDPSWAGNGFEVATIAGAVS